MAKFDSMHFENSKGHALASLTSAEKYLEDGDLEGARIAFNCARPYIKIMENEANNEGAPKSKDNEWKELQNRLASLCDKYHEMKEAAENEEDETTENEEVEEEKNVDVLKLNEVVATTIETIREFNKDFSVDDVEEMDRAIVLIQGLKKAVDSDLSSILEKLEDARKDAEIIAKVEAIRESFNGTNQTIEETIDELRHFSELEKGDGRTATLSAAAIFAAIHQTTDEIDLDYESFYQTFFECPYSGLDYYNFRYYVEDNVCGTIGVYLDLFLCSKRTGDQYKLATIKTLEEGEEVFRKMSALGCEYALAFKNIANNI